MDAVTQTAIAKLNIKVQQLERDVCALKSRLPDEPITAPITAGEIEEVNDSSPVEE